MVEYIAAVFEFGSVVVVVYSKVRGNFVEDEYYMYPKATEFQSSSHQC